MKVGLDSYSFRYAAGLWGFRAGARLSPRDYLRIARDLGLAGVHLADLGHFESLDEAYLTSLRREADEAGLYVELGTGGTDPGHLAAALRAAAALGSPVLRTFVGAFRWDADLRGPALVERAAADLRQVLPQAEALGVRIAIENHLDLLSVELVELLHAVGSEYLGVCLDTGNPLGLLEDPIEAAQALAPYTFTTHLKEFRATLRREGLVLRGAPLGRGDVPNLAIVPILRERSPLGDALPLNIETAVERVTVPIFGEGFAELLGGPDPGALLAFLSRLDLDHPWAEDQLALPGERGLGPDEVLATEAAQIAESAAWALGHFG